MERCGLDLSGSGKGHMVEFCENGNEAYVSVKGGKFLD
jgi:hypothetical protein